MQGLHAKLPGYGSAVRDSAGVPCTRASLDSSSQVFFFTCCKNSNNTINTVIVEEIIITSSAMIAAMYELSGRQRESFATMTTQKTIDIHARIMLILSLIAPATRVVQYSSIVT